VAAVLHLGDLGSDILPFIKAYPGINFHAVSGNCDFTENNPEEKIVTVGNKKIWMLHGHTHGVKSGFTRLSYAAEEKNADICLFGHTHEPALFEENGVLYMNPGSIGSPRGADAPSYGVLEISDAGGVEGRIVGIYEGKGYRPIRF
jgi:putative phosphoesterase